MSVTGRRVRRNRRWGIGVVALLAVIGQGVALADLGGGGSTPEGMIDLTGAVVVVPPGLSGPGKAAVTLLVEEVEKRTLRRWPVADGHVTIDLFSSCLVVTSLIGCGFG